MFRKLIEEQKEYMNFFFDALDLTPGQQLLTRLLHIKGNLVFTGVGKSGQVAKKLASTFISTGTKSLYLNPVEALHGDLGIISKDDVVVYLSKSGNSKELIELAKILYARQIYQVLWVCKEDSVLKNFMDLICLLPLKRELCPYNLSPTTSPLLQMCFGDTLAIALMNQKEFSLDQYADNHPSGFIGTRSRKVREVMLKGAALPIVHQSQPLKEVLIEMSGKRVGCVLVLNENRQLSGIFTTGDLNRALLKIDQDVIHAPIGALMTQSFTCIDANERVDHALSLMQNPDKRIQMLPVMEEGILVGLIHLHDVVEDAFQKGGAKEMLAH
ncbi:MAG: KpsF/GutQ family sugar-phosphate isomerase [Chlamydiia bacterium]